jgi:hypothetical protein
MFADMAKCNAAMLAALPYLLVRLYSVVASWYISIPIPIPIGHSPLKMPSPSVTPIRGNNMYVCMCLVSLPLQASKSRFVVGSHVWVEDPDEAWMDGLVEQINGDELVVNCTSGKKVTKC